MPELPDVETFRRYLAATALHQRIEGLSVESPDLLEGTSPQGLGRRLKGHAFEDTRRHGKYLFARLDDGPSLLLHFGMTGYLEYYHDGRDPPGHTRLLLRLAGQGRLAYVAQRKLGRIAVVDDVDAFVADEGLGPDALALSTEDLAERVTASRGKIKSWLMSQEHLAGLGNVYTDELLYQAGIHPATPLGDLDEDAVRRLHRAMRHVLDKAIEVQAQVDRMPGTWLLPHREEGASCPRCGGTVQRLSVGGRAGYYCPGCQG